MKTQTGAEILKVTTELLHYDVPLVVLALDNLGRTCIGVAFDETPVDECYYFAPVHEAALGRLRSGEADLRTVLTEGRTGDFMVAYGFALPGTSMPVDNVPAGIPDEWLPEPGLMLKDAIELTADGAVLAGA